MAIGAAAPCDTIELARQVRRQVLRMVTRAKASHVGSCLSVTDLLAVLYGQVLRVDPARPDDPERDRLILSKGHAAAALYAVLAERGFFPKAWLERYGQDGQPLAGHSHHYGVPGVEVSTGSLGHGLPIGVGMALAAKRDGRTARTFVVLSDGECDEGSVWEAALFAPQHQLANLVAIVDYNKIQSYGTVKEVLDLTPFAEKWRAFRWAVREIDGHNHREILEATRDVPLEPGRPTAIIAHTIKGKGVSFMENLLLWHYRNPSEEQLQQALMELGGGE
ncbi:MAG: transketolase [Candidatus Binatia bacterium]